MTARGTGTQPSTWERTFTPTPEQQRGLELRRSVLGIVLGAALGLSYGIVGQLINRIALPGVHLYQPPLGPLGNSVLHGLVGAGLGFLSARPANPAPGIFLGSLAAAFAVFISTLLRVGRVIDTGGAVVTSVLFSVPIAWLTVPIVALLRWTTDRLAELSRDHAPLAVRARVPLILILIMVVLATFELLPADARGQLRRADTLLQAGLQASSAAALPAPLRGPLVRGFPPDTAKDYSLEWTTYDLDRFIQLRPPSSYDQHAAVIARFTGGYTLACLYPTARSEPNCGTY